VRKVWPLMRCGNTYKNGIQVMFSMNEEIMLRWPRRYSSNV
jgi:hypothetical protein